MLALRINYCKDYYLVHELLLQAPIYFQLFSFQVLAKFSATLNIVSSNALPKGNSYTIFHIRMHIKASFYWKGMDVQ